MRWAFINNFAEGTGETVKIQCGVIATSEGPTLKDKPPREGVSIAAVITLHSPMFEGASALCFPTATFLNIMSAMLGDDFEEMDKEITHGVAEILNIIFGFTKAHLNEQIRAKDRMAIPSVIKGENVKVSHFTKGPLMQVPFNPEAGEFYIETAIEEKAIS